jgi:hypothetical protein
MLATERSSHGGVSLLHSRCLAGTEWKGRGSVEPVAVSLVTNSRVS